MGVVTGPSPLVGGVAVQMQCKFLIIRVCLLSTQMAGYTVHLNRDVVNANSIGVIRR